MNHSDIINSNYHEFKSHCYLSICYMNQKLTLFTRSY